MFVRLLMVSLDKLLIFSAGFPVFGMNITAVTTMVQDLII
jgi:hypothetical protein